MSARPAERRADAARLAVLAAAWAGLFAAVDPRGAFPLNDDFQYAECARRLLAGDGLRLPQWASSSTAAHALLGALATAPWGGSNQALRFWELCVGLAGAAGVYALARRWKASPDAALLAALSLALSPLWAALSASFHIDVTASALTLAALCSFLRGRRDGDARWLAGASALVGAAGWARQTCFLAAAGGAAALALDRRLTRRAAAALLLPAGAAAAAFWGWLRFAHGPTWAWTTAGRVPVADPSYWLDPGLWTRLGSASARSALTAALSLSPLAVAAAPEAFRRRPSRAESAVLAVLGAAGLAAVAREGGLPLVQNTLHHHGLGVVTLTAGDLKPAGWWGAPGLWAAAGAAALASLLLLVRGLWSAASGAPDGEFRAAVLFAGAPYAAMLLMPFAYDRYLLSVLPVLAAAAAAGSKDGARRLAPAFAAAAVLGAFTWAGLADYFAWNRARWSAGLSAEAHGVPPESVENGFDWDGQFSLTRNMEALLARGPAAEIGNWDWMKMNKVVAATSFSDAPPFPGWRLAGTFPYRSPLAPSGAAVRLFVDARLFRRPARGSAR